MNTASSYNSQQASSTSSRMQSPLMISKRRDGIFRKFINKIPPAIKYGLPGTVIGYFTPTIYNAVKNKFNEIKNSLKPESNETTTVMKSTVEPKPSETPVPRSTYNPAHPRTGYRYHVPFN